MTNQIIRAFVAIHDGYSADRVVADPELNARFLEACRENGLTNGSRDLNRGLLNERKAGKLGRLTTKTTRIVDDEYRFASEIAARHLERREGVSLDSILCDPSLGKEFDFIASEICPGFSSLEYRWAAFRLRKRRALRPEILGQVIESRTVATLLASEIDTTNLPNNQGLYVFFDSTETLYVGEASNLSTRLKKHLRHSDNRELARWLWKNGNEHLHVEIHSLPDGTSTKVRRALETELIQTRKPAFNIQGK
jgi:site-specific DNA-methyltransferase (adenine-specific)